MQFLDKLGWPVERIKGRRIFNLIRLLLHTRSVKLGKFHMVHSSPDAESGPPDVLTQNILGAEQNAAALRVLEKVIPWDILSEEDEKLLWDYFVKVRR